MLLIGLVIFHSLAHALGLGPQLLNRILQAFRFTLLLALEFFEVLFPQLFVIVGCDSLDQLLLFECELSDLV